MAFDLSDLLEEVVGTSKLLGIESRGMMKPSIQLSCLNQRVLESLSAKDLIVGSRRISSEPRLVTSY